MERFGANHGIWSWGLVVVALAAVAGCTDTDLRKVERPEEPRADELRVSGRICTRPPERLTFPTRVLFVVDTSISMQLTDPIDPQTGRTDRERAVRATWERLLQQDKEQARVGIMRFSADAQPRTPVDEDGDGVAESYFTDDRDELDQATRSLRATSRRTSYVNALGEAYFEIRTELESARQESLPRTKYSVVFLSDGAPDPALTTDRTASRDQILSSVEQLRELVDSYDVGEFSFNTAFLATGDAAFDREAEDLLEEMADRGRGTFRSFPNGEELNFLFADLTSLRRTYTLKSLVATNLNAVQDRNQVPDRVPMAPEVGVGDVGDAADGEAGLGVEPVLRKPRPNPLTWVDVNGNRTVECGEPTVDSDGDGLADRTEFEAEIDPRDPDTDDDGLGDRLEWELRDSGLSPRTPNQSKCYTPRECVDDNDDGACDCLFDSNDDGVCDCAEDASEQCVRDGRDCVDDDEDGWCDCRDADGDGTCDFADRDGDSLRDCEEVFVGTSQQGADTDADGLPDPLEVRFNTNPTARDGRDNLDADQTNNELEVRANTNPRCDDSSFRSRVAYQYDVESKGLNGSRSCYEFGIDNITLVPTLETRNDDYPGDGWNRMLLYAGEVAFDAPDSFASYRVACVMARYDPRGNYKEPPSGRVRLSSDDFVEVRDFDPKRDCIWP